MTMTETNRNAQSGWVVLSVLLATFVACIAGLFWAASNNAPIVAAMAVVTLVVASLMAPGFFVVLPNHAKVLLLLGKYVGTVRTPGFCWANPFFSKRPLSLRAVSIEIDKLKVNDLDGNPIEIAAILVWKVANTAQASFEVDNYQQYVRVQSEAALRNLASRYTYDAHDEHTLSLRGNTQQVAEHLQKEVSDRAALAGVTIVEARISHLAYAPEIAQAMLQRQQAGAIIAARQKIVEGAVGMVEMALERLSRNNVVALDEERKATMVSNLLVVLCGERSVQPVINTGTLYQ